MVNAGLQGSTGTRDHDGTIALAMESAQIDAAPPFTGEPGAGRELIWEKLVGRVAHGEDPAALESLIEQTNGHVSRRALRILVSRADAEEITADVYSQVWRTARRYNAQRGCVLAWLLNITNSRAMDRLRARARHGQRYEVSLSFECDSAIYPDYETRRHVRQALLTLPFEQQQALELAYFHGYSMTEIARQLGHPLGTVKSRIRSALTVLRGS